MDDDMNMLDHFREDQIKTHMMGKRIMGIESVFDARGDGDSLTLTLEDGTAVEINAARIRLALREGTRREAGAATRSVFNRRRRRRG
jgi:hypothetical protein